MHSPVNRIATTTMTALLARTILDACAPLALLLAGLLLLTGPVRVGRAH